MKFGTQLGSIGGATRAETLATARRLGCEGLEIDIPVGGLITGALTLDDIRARATEVREDFSRAGLDVISLTPGILLGHVERPELVRAACEAAVAAGTRTIRLFFSPHVRWGGPGSKLDEWTSEFDGTRSARHWIDTDRRRLETWLELSRDVDVRFAFELHHGYTVNSASAAMRLLEPFPPSRVGILMDPGNMVIEGNEGWRNSVQIMGPYLAYLHCKNAQWVRRDSRWRPEWAGLEDGIANYAEIVTALKDEGFGGYLSIEDLRGDRPVDERVGRGIAYLRQLRDRADRVMPV
jgi:sugar phosphate isomerase/epimerase